MISPISFTSTYKVTDKQKISGSFLQFQIFATQKTTSPDAFVFTKKLPKKDGKTSFPENEITLIVPDEMDKEVEAFCNDKTRLIKYRLIATRDLLHPESIRKRIQDAPKGYKKVNIDSKKLEYLAKNQIGNYEECKKEYCKYHRPRVDAMFRRGEEFPTTTLYLGSLMPNAHLEKYVKCGIENLQPNQITIQFGQETYEPDNCVYFGLKGLNLDKIPVYVDDSSYKIGKILQLF